MHTHTHNDYGCYVVATLLLFLAGFFNIEGSNDQHKRTRSTKNESYITITAGDITDLILSMDQGKSGGLCSNSGTLNWHFFVSGLTVIVTTMMVQSAQMWM